MKKPRILNIVDRLLLKVVMYPAAFYRSLGVDTHQMNALLYMKLMIANRRPTPLQEMQQSKRKQNNGNLSSMFLSLFTGLFTSFIFFISDDLVFQLVVFFSLYCLIVGMSIIMDFSTTITDHRDQMLILHRPVNANTFTLSRILFVLIQILKTVIPLTLPAAIILVFNNNLLAGICLIFMVILLTIGLLFFIQAIYLLLLRVVPARKIQRALLIIQIIYGISIFGMAQLVSRIMDVENPALLRAETYSWFKYYPLYYYGIAIKSIAEGNFAIKNVLIILACIFAPILIFTFLFRYLSGFYTGKLIGYKIVNKSVSEVSRWQNFISVLAKIVTNSPVEKSGFLFTWNLSSRSRDYNLKVYPMIGYLMIIIFFPFIGRLLNMGKHINSSTKFIDNLWWASIYYLSILSFVLYSNMIYTENFKASWFWRTSPVALPGQVISGGFKAIFLKFNIIFLIIILLLGIIKMDILLLLNQIFAILNLLIVSILVMLSTSRKLPFSVKPLENQSEGIAKMMITMLVFALAAGIGIFHYFISDNWWALALFISISIVANWLLLSELKNTSWKVINGSKSKLSNELA